MLLKLLLAGAGGFVGAAARVGISHLVASPWATLGINVLGCLGIGLLHPVVKDREALLFFLIPGVLGGFTTFSAFGHETHELVRRGAPGLAALYVAASVFLGLGAVWVGRIRG